MRRLRLLLALHGAVALLAAPPAIAQVAPSASPAPAVADPAVTPVPQPLPSPGQPRSAGSRRTYLPADFARFAPRTAFDMLQQVPGFTIREADEERGLGQASENVLINGERIANKSGGALNELQKVSAANVERIEIVDAATLGVAGLIGQVANVVVTSARAGGGRFEWNPNVRAHYARPNLFSGSASYTGKRGPVDYTLSVEDDAGRGGFGGPVVITDPAGAIIERRTERFHAESDLLTFKTSFTLDGPGSSTGNLALSITPYRSPSYDRDRRVRTDGDDYTRLTTTKLDGIYYDINADTEFALGPGRLKLIGVRHFDDEPIATTQVSTFDSGAASTGIRLGRHSYIQETIARAEYGWKTGRNVWQLSFERAYNALDQRGTLATLAPDGTFIPAPFPDGSGRVEEVRYEGTGTLSRPLSPRLDLQVVLGAETSTLARVDGDLPARHFVRPKGSIALGWRPAAGWDVSLKLRRRVGQIEFYNFLAQPNLRQDRENAGNPDLVPPQSWELEAEAGRELGRWGKSRLRVYGHRVADIIDVIPIGADGQGIGNLPRATRFGAQSTSTILFDAIGWKGAKLDATLAFEHSRVHDPLTGAPRPIGGNHDAWFNLAFRRDVPNGPIAWGGSLGYDHFAPYVYLTERFRSWEGPVFDSLFVEHKDVAGLTVRAEVTNLLDARHRFDRDVYAGRRTTSPLLFRQRADQLIGPIFSLSVRGSF